VGLRCDAILGEGEVVELTRMLSADRIKFLAEKIGVVGLNADPELRVLSLVEKLNEGRRGRHSFGVMFTRG